MSGSPSLSEPLEDYLEAISGLVRSNGEARVGEIAEQLNVHKSTVTAALHSLSRKGLVNYAPYRAATLTDDGEAVASEITRRHESLKRFLSDVLLVDDALAEENACRLEHAVAEEVLCRMIDFADYMESSCADGSISKAAFRAFRAAGASEHSPE